MVLRKLRVSARGRHLDAEAAEVPRELHRLRLEVGEAEVPREQVVAQELA